MAGAYGWKFIFFTLVFYLFLGFLMGTGAGSWLENVTINNTAYNVGNYSTDNAYINPTVWDYTSYILQNPFSGISWLVWLGLAMLITDIYIVVASAIP